MPLAMNSTFLSNFILVPFSLHKLFAKKLQFGKNKMPSVLKLLVPRVHTDILSRRTFLAKKVAFNYLKANSCSFLMRTSCKSIIIHVFKLFNNKIYTILFKIYTYPAKSSNPEHKSALKYSNDCDWLMHNFQRYSQLIGQK